MKADEAQMGVKATEDSEEEKKSTPIFSFSYAPPVIRNRLHMYNQCHSVVLKVIQRSSATLVFLLAATFADKCTSLQNCAQTLRT